MRKESLNIAIACFIGGVLGVFVAKAIAEMYGLVSYTAMWFIAGVIGALMGGAVAYLVYDPSAVISAMRRAWYELADTENLKRWGMTTLREALGVIFVVATFAAVGTSIGGIIFLAVIVDSRLYGTAFSDGGGMLALSLVAFFILNTGMVVFGSVPRKLHPMITKLERNPEFNHTFAFLALATNPVTVALAIPYRLWQFIVNIPRITRIVWHLAVFTARYARAIFVLIHSDKRTICFVDTAIGAMVAYTLVSETLVAMLAGGTLGLIFGLLNYELVSVRWLKIVPAPSLTAGRRVRK
ncbi:MAG: hypothetical protein HYY60_01865 [Parcubacteria group bacterium]|nr:hypothetical protein [Parcubacteria group bacterium]